jgi:hypothetical protein
MEKKLSFSYDSEGDVLDISVGKPVRAISNEIDHELFVLVHPRTKKIVGFSILNFQKRSRKRKGLISIPVRAKFSL